MRKFHLISIASAAILSGIVGCGSNSGSATTLSISGSASINRNTCTAYSIARSTEVTSTTTVQPSIASGQGGVYTNSTCTSVALLNITMAAGTKNATFYFSSNAAGTTTLSVTNITTSSDTAGTLAVSVN